MSDSLKWGLLATGSIANTFARALKRSDNGVAVAVASRTQAAADEFAARYDIPNRHGSYQAMLEDPSVEAVYISTPHPMHVEWVVKTAQAKKHILCEKPIGMNERETQLMVDAARANGVCLMEAFMYRFHPQTLKVLELIRGGAIGEVKVIQGVYGFNTMVNPEGRLYNKALGGGAIMDVGCYPVSSSRLFAGAALGSDFADPLDVQAQGHLGETGVDEWSSAVVKFPGDIIAQWTTGLRLNYENGVRLIGTRGWIHLPRPHHPAHGGGETRILVQRSGMVPLQEITVAAEKPLFTIAIEAFGRAVRDGQTEVTPAMSWADSIGNMRSLDLWRQRIGLRYDMD